MLIYFLLLALLIGVQGDDHTHTYVQSEEVTIWLNKVGPYHNPQETYHYYSLPFCKPSGKKLQHKSNGLGVILEGAQLVDSGLHVGFLEEQHMSKICDMEISEDSAKKFNEIVQQHYWYQMYVDELPIWGMVGEYMTPNEEEGTVQVQESTAFLYTHKAFSISYNGNQIIQVNLTSENPKPITVGATHPLTYSVKWVPTSLSFEDRFDRYLDFDFFEHQIHWFSLFNSFMMVVFLCGLVALILLRTLKSDYARYTVDDEEMELESVVDESGWKQVHGDVFRQPRFLTLFSALLGVGAQFFTLVMMVIVTTLLSSVYDERGSMNGAAMVCYSLTSFVAGAVSGRHYKSHKGPQYKNTMLLTALLFPSFTGCIIFFLNLIAVYYRSLAALGFGTILMIFGIWFFISFPLVIGGTLVGRAYAKEGDFPCRINTLKSPIPDTNWYSKPAALALLSGVLPFGSIFIEMYFIFTSFWNYKFYYVYGFMLLVFIILIIVSVCVTIVSTYFLLNVEDYRWQWVSFFSSGSTALYVYIYAIFYFMTKTRMSGVLQTTYYFGYMTIFCTAMFLMCGSIGYFGANMFVRRIYQYIKSD